MPGKRFSQEKIIELCKKKHGDLYDYTRVIYLGAKLKIEIGCKIHGWFWQEPRHHYRKGTHCPKCAHKNKPHKPLLSQTEIIIRCIETHGDLYSYINMVYKGMKTPVEIICSKHGSFFQLLEDHIRNKSGCPKCGRAQAANSHRNDIDELINEWIITHEGRYIYTSTVYHRMRDKIEIICPEHGSFWQRPFSHSKGNGCPRCNHRRGTKETKWLDSLNIPNDQNHRQVSIYVPNKKFPYQVDGYCPETNTIYEFYGNYYHGNPAKYTDPNKLSGLGNKTYGDLYEYIIKRENALRTAGHNIVFIWENDWDMIQNETKRLADINSTNCGE